MEIAEGGRSDAGTLEDETWQQTWILGRVEWMNDWSEEKGMRVTLVVFGRFVSWESRGQGPTDEDRHAGENNGEK
jgi:hypothetical protein